MSGVRLRQGPTKLEIAEAKLEKIKELQEYLEQKNLKLAIEIARDLKEILDG